MPKDKTTKSQKKCDLNNLFYDAKKFLIYCRYSQKVDIAGHASEILHALEICFMGSGLLESLNEFDSSIISKSSYLKRLKYLPLTTHVPRKASCLDISLGYLSLWGEALELYGLKNAKQLCQSIGNLIKEIPHADDAEFFGRLVTLDTERMEEPGSEAYKAAEFFWDNKLLRSNFGSNSSSLARSIYRTIFEKITISGPQSDISLWLRALVTELRKFRQEFILKTSAQGPAVPTVKSVWYRRPAMNNIVLPEVVGNLEFRYGRGELIGVFIVPQEEPIKWRNQCSIHDYEMTLFSTWSYKTGKYLDLANVEGCASWLVPHIISWQLENEVLYVEKLLIPLFEIPKYKSLADSATKIVRNNSPKWSAERVRWSYIMELDEVIKQVENASKQNKEEQEPITIKEPTDISIPSERRSAPLSLARMAQYWGGEITAKKLRTMINNDRLQVYKINRQTFIFDIKFLPEHVITKVKK
ncbi:hypothetical protein ACFL1G_05880 [Planctomycetota bacterium]